MALLISEAIGSKLATKHNVTKREIEQCFDNRTGGLLLDTRPGRATDPPTRWFIAETNRHRSLKIVFVQVGNDIHLKTAYEPNAVEMDIYRRFS